MSNIVIPPPKKRRERKKPKWQQARDKLRLLQKLIADAQASAGTDCYSPNWVEEVYEAGRKRAADAVRKIEIARSMQVCDKSTPEDIERAKTDEVNARAALRSARILINIRYYRRQMFDLQLRAMDPSMLRAAPRKAPMSDRDRAEHEDRTGQMRRTRLATEHAATVTDFELADRIMAEWMDWAGGSPYMIAGDGTGGPARAAIKRVTGGFRRARKSGAEREEPETWDDAWDEAWGQNWKDKWEEWQAEPAPQADPEEAAGEWAEGKDVGSQSMQEAYLEARYIVGMRMAALLAACKAKGIDRLLLSRAPEGRPRGLKRYLWRLAYRAALRSILDRRGGKGRRRADIKWLPEDVTEADLGDGDRWIEPPTEADEHARIARYHRDLERLDRWIEDREAEEMAAGRSSSRQRGGRTKMYRRLRQLARGHNPCSRWDVIRDMLDRLGVKTGLAEKGWEPANRLAIQLSAMPSD